MSLINPYEFDETPDTPEDEHAFPCAECGDRCGGDDPTNGRIGNEWYCADCYAAHPVVVGSVMAAMLADERRGK